MKQYVVDELRIEDFEKIKNYLDTQFSKGGVDGVYWLQIPEALLDNDQSGHSDCRPHYFSLELDDTRLSCELLVRAKDRIRCDCIKYATGKQRNWLIDTVDAILEQLEIIT